MEQNERYIFAGGGTGGHLYPAIAIAESLKKKRPQCEIHFVGTRRGIENRVVPELGYPLHLVAVRGIVRSLTLKNLLAPLALVWSVFQSAALLLKLKPAAVIGTGGYVSGPVLMVASLLNIPTLIQEQNSYPGATTRLLARFVDRVHISFRESEKYFKAKEKLRLTGNPVREFDMSRGKETAKKALGFDPGCPVLLVTGGSQGAHAINSRLLQSLDALLSETALQIIWSTGKADFDNVKAQSSNFGDRIVIQPFISDMETVLLAADLIIARAGAITLAEITRCGVPAILVPYPYAAANHQAKNAQALAKEGAAVVIDQSQLNAERLIGTIKRLLSDQAELKAMSSAAKRCAFPAATESFVESVLHVIENKRALP